MEEKQMGGADTRDPTGDKSKQIDTYNHCRHLKELIHDIRAKLMSHKDKAKFDCFCEIELPKIDTIFDIFKHYGVLCYCMINHVKHHPFDRMLFIQIFLLEISLINILRKNDLEFHSVLFNGCNIYADNSINNQMIDAYSTYVSDKKIHVNCEQPIESLSYKYFKQYSHHMKSSNAHYLDYLLFLLVVRNESERFFNVFTESNKTDINYRCALLLSLCSECCVEGSKILKDCKRFTRVIEDSLMIDVKKMVLAIPKDNDKRVFNLESLYDDEILYNRFDELFAEEILEDERICLKSFEKKVGAGMDSDLILLRFSVLIYNLINLEKQNIDEWFKNKMMRQDWHVNLKTWAFNRTESLDISMISFCVKHKKFDEGWLVYTKLQKKPEDAIARATSLCIKAIVATEDNIWVERVCDILSGTAVIKNQTPCQTVTKMIVENLQMFSETMREKLTQNLVSIFDKFNLEKNEYMIYYLMKGFFTMVSECKTERMCQICSKHAINIYNRWKDKYNSSFLFFRRKSIYYDEIYSFMLGVCDETNDCNKFHAICQDLLKDDEDVGNGVLCRLEKYHRKCQCNSFSGYAHVNDKPLCKGLLKHCMCEFKK